jgi:hypothetical protein
MNFPTYAVNTFQQFRRQTIPVHFGIENSHYQTLKQTKGSPDEI